MADSRNKGASFERDLVKRLNTFFTENGFDFECKRNLDQYQSAGTEMLPSRAQNPAIESH